MAYGVKYFDYGNETLKIPLLSDLLFKINFLPCSRNLDTDFRFEEKVSCSYMT
jgi:hypothetical protein